MGCGVFCQQIELSREQPLQGSGSGHSSLVPPAHTQSFLMAQPQESTFDECKGSKGRIVSLITAPAVSSKHTNELSSVCYDNLGQIKLVLIPPVVQLKSEMLHSICHALLWDCNHLSFVAGKYVLSWGLFSSGLCRVRVFFIYFNPCLCTLITSISSQG